MKLLLCRLQHSSLGLRHAAGEARTCRTDMTAAADLLADSGRVHLLLVVRTETRTVPSGFSVSVMPITAPSI